MEQETVVSSQQPAASNQPSGAGPARDSLPPPPQADAHLQQMVDGWKNDPTSDAHSAGRQAPADANSREANPQTGNPKPAVAAAEFDAALLRHARDAGFSDEEARAFGDPAKLQRALTAYDREMLNLRRGRQNGQPTQQQQPPQRQPQTPPSQQAPREEQPARDASGRFVPREEKFELKLDPNLVDPEIISGFNALQGHYESRIARLEAALEEAAPVIRRSWAETQQIKVQQFDTALEKLGESFAELFGNDPTDELDPQSAHFQNRDKIFIAANELAEEYQARGKRVPRFAELVRRAAYSEFGDKLKQQARAEVKAELERRQEESTSPPSHRNGRGRETPVGDDEYAVAENIWSKRGIPFVPRQASSKAWDE